jgi:predicted nucleic-acid-binding protein
VIGVDTNVLARLFVTDDERQHLVARSFFAERSSDDPAFVSNVVVAELVWLLDRTFDYPRARILEVLDGILGSPDFVLERREVVEDAVDKATTTKASIADALIAALATSAGCTATMTFDRDASRHVPGMELLR